MTRRLISALLAVLLATPAAAARDDDRTALRAMTYNIRLDLASDGANSWAYRQQMVGAVIRHEAPDLLGLQEVLHAQKRDLELALPEYQLVGVARDDGREKGEYSSLAFRRERFKLIDSGTFWLSETPDVPGKGWDAAFPRIATWAVLRDRKSRQSIRVINTHFDHIGLVARQQSAAQLLRWINVGAAAKLPTILMGDLNSTPDDPGYKLFAETQTSGLRDARLASRTPAYGPPGTFNAFKFDRDAPAPIDHVFVSGGFSVESYSVVTQHWGGRLPSDHYPVVVDVTFNRK